MPMNPIVVENQLPGSPASEWDIADTGDGTFKMGDPAIQGFATNISANLGETISFKIKLDTQPIPYRIDIYRLGHYGGLGARKVATVNPPPSAFSQNQPACLCDAATGLIDCGNWTVSASWQIPSNAVSGVYLAKLNRLDVVNGKGSHIVFIVRDDARHSDILFQTSDTTWHAYNAYADTANLPRKNSLYGDGGGSKFPDGRAYKVSYNRPFDTRSRPLSYGAITFLFDGEYPMIRWLEANGYDVAYCAGVDTDRSAGNLLNHKLFLSVGHDEYWSGQQRTNVENARNAGVHLGFFSGNEMFWKTRWEASIDGSHTAYRTLVCYKETYTGTKIDPTPTWTGTWRDPRLSPPADGGRPENALTGTLFTVNAYRLDTISVPAALGRLRFWRNTAIATLAPNQSATLTPNVLGFEWDQDVDDDARPPGLVRLSSSTISLDGNYELLDQGATYGPGTAVHSLTLYRHASGALVFGAGTPRWSWGLDSNHDSEPSLPDVRMQQATVNLFADMGVQPATLQTGLVAASPSNDVTPPTSTITFPASGASVERNDTVTVTGTAADTGGKVGGVEVSVDGGTSWHPATGLESWSYQWMPRIAGPATIRSRAVDDSGNRETPGAGVSVTVVAAAFSGSIWDNAALPSIAAFNDPNPIALGVKFRSDVDGFVTGIRFYKGPANVAPHVGSLWTESGTLLASVSFSNETTLGWQQASLSTPVPITAGAVYVASYHTTAGRYAADPGFFASSEIVSGPLHGLRDGADGGNGVFAYGTSTVFPNNSFEATNYWVDVAVAVGPTTFSGSLWNDDTTPSVTAWDDSNAVTVGMKFSSDSNGFVTGMRFYKEAENAPPHIGNLWTANGTLLASVTFDDETASGWQEASFSTPVPIMTGTTYVVSYHTTVGHYAADPGYFAGSEAVNGPLHGLRDDAAGGNGVFSYGPNSTFPVNNFGATNYWVDIIFSDQPA
jgi:hypothetical protein